MTPRLSGHISKFGLVFFLLWPVSSENRKTMELWKICLFVYEALESFWNFNIWNVVYWWHHRCYKGHVVLHWHLPECWVTNVLRQKFHLVASFLKNLSVNSVNLQVKVYLQSFWPAKLIFAWSRAFNFGWPYVGKNTPWKNHGYSTCDNEHWVFLVIQHMIVLYLYGVNEQPYVWHKTIKYMQSISNVLVKHKA